jgi:hypothetical protein
VVLCGGLMPIAAKQTLAEARRQSIPAESGVQDPVRLQADRSSPVHGWP